MSKTKWYTKPIRRCELKLRAKRRGSVAILLALALVLSLGITALPMAGTVEASPGEWYVDDDSATGGDGTTPAITGDHRAFHTIGDAITAAAPTGDTINVAAGTYSSGVPLPNSTIEVNKSLTLLGANAGECAGVLPGDRGDESVIDDTVLVIDASGVTVDGFLFDGGAMYWGEAACIYGKNLSHLTISNNIFLLGQGKDEYLEDPPPEHIPRPRRAMILGTYNGIAANKMAVTCNDIGGLPGGSVYINPWMGVGTDVLFQYNSFHDNAGGISNDATGVSILNNDFTGNGTGLCSVGNDVIVRDNNFDSNGTNIKIGSEWGFPVVTGVSILGNDIQNSVSDTGILLKENAAAGNEAHFNNIVGNDIGVKNKDPDDTFDATCNWWGDADGPSGQGLGSGDAVSSNVIFVPWLLSEDGPCLGGLPPLVLKAEAKAELESIYPTGDKKVDKGLEKAIKHLDKSMDEDLWVDDAHLEVKHGKKVFDEEKKVVKELKKLIDKTEALQDVKDECQLVIGKLCTADGILARTACEEAQAYADGPKVDKELEKCDKELEKAGEELDKGRCDKAIDHFKKAWEHAQKAMK